ncbi:MAG: hypothetical protein KDM63_21160, partial [Verrucomicrobiae bacterium]|nr:hypothetical protein [Verrucomicrobiae bacterium]
ANERLRRAGIILGSMESAFRFMVRKCRFSDVELPGFFLPPTKILSFDSNYPRPSHQVENLVGEAIFHQCAGMQWPPAKVAALRLCMGYGMDPWIASATPNPWPDMKAWPSDFEVERWIDDGASSAAEIAQQIKALLESAELAPDKILLGAVLRIPTFRRDLEYRFWLAAPMERRDRTKRVVSSTPYSRSFASWLGGWSIAASLPPGVVSVQFPGTLVNFPNGELDVTPTDGWIRDWGWCPDPQNALRFCDRNGDYAAWYERWLGPNSYSRRSHRQPLLGRWIARRGAFPPEFASLQEWQRFSEVLSHPLSRPE